MTCVNPQVGKQAHNAVPSQSVHLIESQGGAAILKASMTKHGDATKQLDISTPPLERIAKLLLAVKISKMKSLTFQKIL